MIPRYLILTRDVANSIIEGYIFIYSCSAKFVSFQDDCFVCERKLIYEHAPNYRVRYATDFIKGSQKLWIIAKGSI